MYQKESKGIGKGFKEFVNMKIVNKIKGLLRWVIKESNRKEIRPIIPKVTIPNLLKGKVAIVMGGGGVELARP